MKKWNLIKASVLTALGFKADHNTKLDLSAEEKQKVNKLASGGKEPEGDLLKFADVFAEKFNKEIDALADNADAQKVYADFLAENQIDPSPDADQDAAEDDADVIVPDADAKSTTQAMQQLVKANATLQEKNQKLSADNKKLKDLPEEDLPEAVIKMNPQNTSAVKHSKTHLFASGQSYDGLDRPWNRRVVDASNGVNKIGASTVWDKINIDKLNTDLGAYARRNASEIMDLFMDGYDIPAHWPVISNIQDQYVFTSIVTGQITQAFKKAWLPKNNQRFIPVINKIFDKQIDVTWEASELKSIEKSWLNMFFNEGSTPYKDSFAAYLFQRLMNQARKEDKISIFKGAYSDPEIQPEVAGDFINSMNGFLKLTSQHKNVDYLPHDLPLITPTNAYDTIQDWLENKIPIDFRNTPGLKLGVGNDVHRWYVEGRETKKGLMPTYKEDVLHPEDFMNIDFVKHPQLEGSGLIYLTVEDNIGLMVDVPGEENGLTIEKRKRAIDAFADWKLGVFFKAFGGAVDPDAPMNFDNQIFFSNNVDVLTDVYVPVAANDATPSVSEHNALKLGGNNTSTTNVTKLDDVVEGVTYHLIGDSASNYSTIKNNANIILSDGDFVLEKGNKISLVALSGGKVIEYSRKVASSIAEPTKVTLDADATTADAESGAYFITQDNTAATALLNITNAIVDEVYTIEGGSDTDSTTIASAGNFLLSASFTASDGSVLKVKYNGSKFVELSRS